MKGKKRNFKVGNFNTNAIRKRPNPERVNNFINEMGKDYSDFDVYLWGSWPQKESTWDLDLLLQRPGEIDTEEMEKISLRSLDASLNKNNFLADVGYTERDITPFNQLANNYVKNGTRATHSGYVYGDKWYVDDEMFKDRMQFQNGVVSPKNNNILKINSLMPYNKMIDSLKDGNFDSYYKDKPLKIKERKKIYGL